MIASRLRDRLRGVRVSAQGAAVGAGGLSFTVVVELRRWPRLAELGMCRRGAPVSLEGQGQAVRRQDDGGELMHSDSEIRENVVRELERDPQVADAAAIGVAVRDGAVTLTGHVSAVAEKAAATQAAERVYGVKSVANDLEVKLPGDPRDDSDIATALAHIIEHNLRITEGRVLARVQDGWVTLDGQVDDAHQRSELERMARHVRGVVGVTDLVEVRPPATTTTVESQIEDALRSEAEVDASNITVEVSDAIVRLFGQVHSLQEADAATAAAISAPGVAAVESHLVIFP